jgi:hypothetical protein
MAHTEAGRRVEEGVGEGLGVEVDKRRGGAEEKEQQHRENRGAEVASRVENRCDCCHSFGILYLARSREQNTERVKGLCRWHSAALYNSSCKHENIERGKARDDKTV